MSEIQIVNWFDEQVRMALPCEDGTGRMDYYDLFDGVTVMEVCLETHSFQEEREARDALEINFCASGRFESRFSAHDRVTLTPRDMAVSTFDGMHGTVSKSLMPLVGEENAEATIAYMLSSCTAEIYGPEAAAAYEANPEETRFDCYFLGGMVKMTVEGNRISGVDAEGNEVFSHEYTLQNIENENGFLFYKTDDADAGMFTWFAFSPDTMATTWHLEFRYAEDEADLESWFTGNYSYWNAAGIAENYTEEEINSAIELFATENLSAEDDAA